MGLCSKVIEALLSKTFNVGERFYDLNYGTI